MRPLGKCYFRLLAVLAATIMISCGKDAPAESGNVTPNPPATQGKLRILGIGNSWTRDSYRYIRALANSAGVDVIAAHAYLGGSTLGNQYYGIDDPDYSFSHSSKQQKVHFTYQYWLYDGKDSAVKDPIDDNYGNGLKGVGLTLEEILNKQPWDVITFQPSSTYINSLGEYLGTSPSSSTSFTMERFVTKVLSLLPEEVAAKVKIGVMVPWSYPTSCTSHSSFVYNWNGSKTPSDQDGWDRAFDVLQTGHQENMPKVAQAMGRKCDYYINVGKAIYFARHNEILSQCGYTLQREADDTHLSEGIAKYVASQMYVYEILGITPDQIKYAPTNYDFSAERIAEAKKVAWAAFKGDKAPVVTSVKTLNPVRTGNSSVTLRGTFFADYANSAKDFTCGFDVREGAGDWVEKKVSDPFYNFSYSLSGLNDDTNYSVKAWVECPSGKVYGPVQNINTGAVTRLILSPSADDFKSQGLPAVTAYPQTGPDPGQAAFADKKFIYTHPDTGEQYTFVFYGYGPQDYNAAKYYLYFGYAGSDFMFGKAGSYIKLPAIPGKKLVEVTITCNMSSKSWGISDSPQFTAPRSAIAGGGPVSIANESHTFILTETEPSKSYYIFSNNGTTRINLTAIVYE